MKAGARYKSRNGAIHTLTITQREGAGWRWVNCLALMDCQGRWSLSCHWRTNAAKQAHRELTLLGYTLVDDGQ